MITPALLRSWRACWTDHRIKSAFGLRHTVTPREVAIAPDVSLDNRLWVLCACIAHLDESAARLYAIESAATVTHLAGDKNDQAQYAGILAWLIEIEDMPDADRVARCAARDSARDAARCAAWDADRVARCAARDAARDAARCASWDAARDAAWDAAWYAARDAARDAAWYAAWGAARAAAAARDAARQSSVDRALHWLGDYADGWESDGLLP